VAPGVISELILKIIYAHSVLPAGRIAEALRLPFSSVVDGLIEALKANHDVEVQGADGPLRVTYRYALTEKGRALVPLIEHMRAYGRAWLDCGGAQESCPEMDRTAAVAAA